MYIRVKLRLSTGMTAKSYSWSKTLKKDYLEQTLIPVVFVTRNGVTVRVRIIHLDGLRGMGSQLPLRGRLGPAWGRSYGGHSLRGHPAPYFPWCSGGRRCWWGLKIIRWNIFEALLKYLKIKSNDLRNTVFLAGLSL